MTNNLDSLVKDIRACRHCKGLEPRPIVRGRPEARLLIISQAPGTRVHETGLSFDDRSGDRLRLWLGLDRKTFYDESRVAIMGIGIKANNQGVFSPNLGEAMVIPDARRQHQAIVA